MSSSADLVLKNTAWRLEAITPTDQATCPDRFQRYSPGKHPNPKAGSGVTRWFAVEWLGSKEDSGATCATMREAIHAYSITVLYAVQSGDWEDWQVLALQDRHKIRECLRADANPSTGVDNRKGYDDDHATDDIGLMARRFIGDSLDKETDPKLWRLVFEVACKIREEEV